MFKVISIITFLFLFITSVKADQNDPRLNNLFKKLNKTENQQEISNIIKDIWDIWYEVDDPKVIEYFEIIINLSMLNKKFINYLL